MLTYSRLPSKLYPEYHNIHKMMASDSEQSGYTPYQQTEILAISPDKSVTIRREDQDIVIKVTSD